MQSQHSKTNGFTHQHQAPRLPDSEAEANRATAIKKQNNVVAYAGRPRLSFLSLDELHSFHLFTPQCGSLLVLHVLPR